MTELYVNNVLCDLGDAKIAETKQINNFFEIKDRQTSYTNRFVLPPTPRNKEIYDMFGVEGNTSLFPYRIHRADLVRNGINTIIDGKAIGTKFNHTGKNKGLEVSIQSGNISFYNSIENKTLSSLDYSGINLDVTNNTYRDSFTNTATEGFVFALADYGDISDIVNVNTQVPAVFYQWLFDKIWDESGFTYEYVGENNPFEDEKFSERIFFADRGLNTSIVGISSVLVLQLDYSETSISDLGYIAFNVLTDVNAIHDLIRVNTSLSSIINTEQEGYYRFEMQGTYNDGEEFLFQVQKNETVIYTSNGGFNEEFYLTSNDVISFRLLGNVTDVQIQLDILYKAKSNRINFSNYWEKIKQKDFVKHVFQDYGIVFQKIEGTKRYQLITLNDLFFKINDSVDMSDNYDFSISDDARINSLGKENYLRHKYEDDSQFADGFFSLDNETLSEEIDMFTSIMYALEKSDFRYDNVSLEKMNHFQIKTDTSGNVTEIKGKKTKPYSALISRNNIDFSYKVNEVINFYNGLIPVARFNKLNYAYRVNGTFGVYRAVMNRFVRMVVSMKLSALDVYNFDFFKLRYVKQLGNYYYVNKISNYTSKKKTRVELIKIDRSDVLGEYSNDYSEDYNI